MRKIRILWTDDEIEILQPHIIFLTEKGYEVETCTNGNDTLDLVRASNYDIIFLDENMPGMSGIDTLKQVKQIRPAVPVVMITKSEEENIMDDAIGAHIADYLIKPVKPNQILLCLKKNTDSRRIVTEKTTSDYRSDFNRIGQLIGEAKTPEKWTDIYKKLVYWDIQLDKNTDASLRDIFLMQEQEANNAFSRFVSSNYLSWLGHGIDKPLMSPALMREKVFPHLDETNRLFFIVIDNLRYDHWKIIAEELTPMYRITGESIYYSILPTATQYSRNAVFSGLMPAEIQKRYPELWVYDDEDEGKNQNEGELLQKQLARLSLDIKCKYHKISSNAAGKKINENLSDLFVNDLNVLVFNFVDLISHARTEIELIRDLAGDEPAYRSLTHSWFRHSPLFDLLKYLSTEKVKVIISTDHGTVKVNNPVKVTGDRNTSANLRYKLGRNLDYRPSEVFELSDPNRAGLPKSNISSRYIFARNYDFLVYPNNYNHFVKYFRNTFQHGGISMQEMLIPVASLEPK
ncbi:MAG: bifunctional response regulator/alkaline phosphatase family protein [Bacteroidales bacterium]|nr:bifunctional response regulator/alkaline phosphatase family protein [Bacteroidales bacterium]